MPRAILVLLAAAMTAAGPARTIPGRRVEPLAQAVVSWRRLESAGAARAAPDAPDGPDATAFPDGFMPLVPVPPAAGPAGPAAPQPVGVVAPPELVQGFPAAQRPDTADPVFFPDGIRPPDTMGAVGPAHFMEVINGNVSIFDKVSGDRLSSVALVSFFEPVHTRDIPYDPRVLFDQHSGRWVAMAADCRCQPVNTIVFGVSRTDDPTGEWLLASFSANGFADYPTLGVDAGGLYIAAAVTEKLWVIDKAPLLADPPSVGAITEFDVVTGGALHPAHTWGAPGAEYLVRTGSSTTLRVLRVTGPAAAPLLADLGSITVPAYASPHDVPTLGSTVPISVGSGSSSRLQGAVYRDGSLWTCHTILDGARNACRWYQLDPAAPAAVQSGTVADPLLEYYYPTLAVTADGDVAMGFSGSSAFQFVGTYFTGRRAADAPGAMAPPVELKAGESAYTVLDTVNRNRWGDYSATTLDPVDETTVWTIQEYASSPQNTWGTWVGRLSYEGVDCPWDCGDGNGTVDTVDFLALLAEWGATGTPCDFDGTGVGTVAFLDLLAHWGACP